MAAVNHERLTQLFLELVQIDSLSRCERDVAIRLQHETENAGAVCRYEGLGRMRPLQHGQSYCAN